MLISRAGDLLIFGTDALLPISGSLGNEYFAEGSDGGESIYLGVEIKKGVY